MSNDLIITKHNQLNQITQITAYFGNTDVCIHYFQRIVNEITGREVVQESGGLLQLDHIVWC